MAQTIAQKLEAATRTEEEYACPDCNSRDYFSPTYKQRKCCSCGHRGSETEFRISPEADCPDCGASAPKTHEHGYSNIHTCRNCYNQFEN